MRASTFYIILGVFLTLLNLCYIIQFDSHKGQKYVDNDDKYNYKNPSYVGDKIEYKKKPSYGHGAKAPDCIPLHFWNDDRHHPITAMASIPGSGSTWMRHLIHQTTGVHTGSVYNSALHGFLGGGITNSSVIVVKTHLLKVWKGVRQVVLLIRHPLHASVAEFNRQIRKLRTRAERGEMLNKNWATFGQDQLQAWYSFNKYWLSFPGPVHVLWFEDLLQDLPRTLQLLMDFFELEFTENQLQCVLSNSGSQFHRAKTPHDISLEVYPQNVLKAADKYMADMKGLISKQKENNKKSDNQ